MKPVNAKGIDVYIHRKFYIWHFI